jgi:hypothetical protein
MGTTAANTRVLLLGEVFRVLRPGRRPGIGIIAADSR